MGKHEGIHHWTIGQRCKIPGSPYAYFVFHKDLPTNNIAVVKSTHHPALYTDILIAHKPHWITSEPPELIGSERIFNCDFRFQHRNVLIACKVFKTKNNHLIIQLSEPLRAITKGQYAVFYSDQICLGGAEILYPGPSYFTLNKSVDVHALTLCMTVSTP